MTNREIKNLIQEQLENQMKDKIVEVNIIKAFQGAERGHYLTIDIQIHQKTK